MLKITAPAEKNKNSSVSSVFMAFVLFVGIMGVFFSMLEISVPGGFRVVPPLESFKTLLNHLFTVSEGLQAYVYEHFVVSVSPENYMNYLFMALVIIGVLAAAYVYILRKLKSKVMCGCLFLFFTVTQIYFGVFAAPFWNIVFFAALAWFLLHDANIVVYTSVITATALVVLLFYPGESTRLSQLSETIRDQFGERVERQVIIETMPLQNELAARQLQHLEMSEASLGDQPGGRALGIERDEIFGGSQIGAAIGQRIWVLWLIGLAFAVGFGAWFFLRLIKAYKKRAVFNSPDCAAAIDSMFKHMVEWLVEFGLRPQNLAYVNYAPRLKLILSKEYAKEYLQIVDLWQKTVYSTHTMTENDKIQMRSFLSHTKKNLTAKLNLFSRAQVKFRLFIRE